MYHKVIFIFNKKKKTQNQQYKLTSFFMIVEKLEICSNDNFYQCLNITFISNYIYVPTTKKNNNTFMLLLFIILNITK